MCIRLLCAQHTAPSELSSTLAGHPALPFHSPSPNMHHTQQVRSRQQQCSSSSCSRQRQQQHQKGARWWWWWWSAPKCECCCWRCCDRGWQGCWCCWQHCCCGSEAAADWTHTQAGRAGRIEGFERKGKCWVLDCPRFFGVLGQCCGTCCQGSASFPVAVCPQPSTWRQLSLSLTRPDPGHALCLSHPFSHPLYLQPPQPHTYTPNNRVVMMMTVPTTPHQRQVHPQVLLLQHGRAHLGASTHMGSWQQQLG